jgi:hypothetical protein
MTQDDKSRYILRELSRLAKVSTLSINELRVVLALERVVARIEAHKGLRDKLVFKGGFVLLKSFGSQRSSGKRHATANYQSTTYQVEIDPLRARAYRRV